MPSSRANPLNVRQQFLTTDRVRLEVETDPATWSDQNLVANPSGELGVWWWENVTNNDARWKLYPSRRFSSHPNLTLECVTGGSGAVVLASGYMPVQGGDWLSGSFFHDAITAGRNLTISVEFSLGPTAIHSTPTIAGPLSNIGSATTRYFTPVQIPANIRYARLLFSFGTSGMTAGDYVSFSQVQVTTDTVAHATPSYVAPFGYANILSGSHQLDITRTGMDVSTLQAVVVDPALDPSTDPDQTLATGKRIRVMAWLEDFNAWEPIFTGKIDEATTDYITPNKARPHVIKPRVTITAYGPATDLANIKTPRAYDTLAGLASNYEAAPWPWWLDGYAGFGANGPAVATNSNASLLDQTLVTRDTISGIAFANRRGQIEAWSPALTPQGARVHRAANGLSYLYAGTTGTNITTTDHNGLSNPVKRVQHSSALPVVSSYIVRAVRPGHTYTFDAWVKAVTTGRSCRVRVEWFGIEGASFYPIATDTGANVSDSNWGWTAASLTATAPLNAYTAAIYVEILTPAAGEQHYIDTIEITEQPFTYTEATAPSAHEDSYTSLVVDWASSSLINSVTIKYLRPIPGADAEEVTYGPWHDFESVRAYGRYAATVTVVATVESHIAFEALAQAILAANATPKRIVRSMKVAVQTDPGIRHAALTDIGDVLDISHTGLIDAAPRVTQIRHTITPAAWLVEYGFEPADSVAVPLQTASPGKPGTYPGTPTLILTKNGNQSISSASFATVAGWTTSYERGWPDLLDAPLPGVYLVTASLSWAANVNNRRIARIMAGGTEHARSEFSPNTSGLVPTHALSAIVKLNAGDTIELQAYQNTGSALNVTDLATRLQIYRLGD